MAFLNLPKRNNIGVLLLLGFIWGTSFILIKRGLVHLSPIQVASLRVGTGGLVLFPLAIYIYKRIEKRYLPKLLLSGLIGTFIPGILFSNAGTRINSAASGSLNALTPIFTLLIGAILYHTKVTWLQISGVLIGFSGAVVLAATKGGWVNIFNINAYALFVVLASLLYGINIHLTKRWFATLEPTMVSVGTTCQVGFLGLAYLTSDSSFWQLLSHAEPINIAQWFNFYNDADKGVYYSIACIIFLGATATGFANLLFMKLIKESSPVFASSTTYIIPVFAVLWGVFDQEKLGLSHFCGMAAILVGVLLVNKSQ